MGHHCKDSKCHSDKKNEGGCISKPISQCLINKAKGNLVILKSGKYHLTEDINGTISIQSNNVCLDLCCHNLDANGAANAIVIGEALVEETLISSKHMKQEDFSDKIFSLKKNKGRFNKNNTDDIVVLSTDKIPRDSVTTFDTENLYVLEHIRVFNGSVTGSVSNGIFANKVYDLDISDLTMKKNSLNNIHVIESAALKITNVDFLGGGEVPSGERAVLLNKVKGFHIENCNVTEFLSTIGALVEIILSRNGLVKDVNVIDNIKTSITDAFYFSPGTAFLFVGNGGFVEEQGEGCKNIEFLNLHVDNNKIRNTDPDVYGFRTFECVCVANSTNINFKDSSVSNNVDELGNSADLDTEDFYFVFTFCENCIVKGLQANNNRCDGQLYWCGVAVAFDSINITFEDSSASNNYLDSLVPTVEALFQMFWYREYLSGDFTFPRGCRYIRCVANDNFLRDGGEGRDTGDLIPGVLSAIIGSGSDLLIQGCEANRNSMGTKFPLNIVVGIGSDFADNALVIDSIANKNTGGDLALGINLFCFSVYGKGTTADHCVANDNQNIGISLGLPGLEESTWPVLQTTVKNCEIKRNGTDFTGISAGIYITPTGLVEDVSIQNCNIVETGRFSSEAYGIVSPLSSDSIVIEDCNILRTGKEYLRLALDPPVAGPFLVEFTQNGPTDTLPITGIIEQTNPVDPCDGPLDNLTGKIGVADFTFVCGSGVIADNLEAANASGGVLIVPPGFPLGIFGGNSTLTAVGISTEDANILLQAIYDNPGLVGTIEFFGPPSFGIKLEGTKNSKLIRNEVFTSENGIVLENSTNSLVQDCHTISNDVSGFSDSAFGDNTWIGNKAQNNGTDYVNIPPGNISIYNKTLGTFTGGTAPNISSVSNLSIL